MKTLLVAAALLSLSAVAVRAADAPKPADQKKCDQIDADLTKLYAQHNGLLRMLKSRHLLAERKRLNCPGNPPPPPEKKK